MTLVEDDGCQCRSPVSDEFGVNVSWGDTETALLLLMLLFVLAFLERCNFSIGEGNDDCPIEALCTEMDNRSEVVAGDTGAELGRLC